jgi:amino acid transporter
LKASILLRFQIIAASIKVGLLLGIVILAGVRGRPSNLNHPFANSTLDPDPIIASVFNAWFAFDGYDIAAIVVEEVVDPRM